VFGRWFPSLGLFPGAGRKGLSLLSVSRPLQDNSSLAVLVDPSLNLRVVLSRLKTIPSLFYSYGLNELEDA